MRKQLPLLVLAFVLVGCGGITPDEANKRVDAGHKLWDEGKKPEAVAKYKEALPDSQKDVRFREDDRPKVFQRIVEFDLEKGDEASAKKFIERAVVNKVGLTFADEKAKALVTQIEQKVAELEAAAKAEQERQAKEKATSGKTTTEKLAAFDKVVECWKSYIGSGDDDEKKKKWVARTEQAQKAFAAIPFNPKGEKAACQEMLKRYQSELGFLKDLSQAWHIQDDISTADERHLLRELTKLLEPIFKVASGIE